MVKASPAREIIIPSQNLRNAFCLTTCGIAGRNTASLRRDGICRCGALLWRS
jgi:hypothetical protein